MLDIKFVRDNVEVVKKAIRDKQLDLDIEAILKLDQEVIKLKGDVQELQTERNSHSKRFRSATPEERPKLIEEGRQIGKKLDEIKPLLQAAEDKLQELLWLTPNVPSPDAPIGKSEEDNLEVHKEGQLPKFDFKPRDHVEILEMNSWADFERIAEVSGSRSYSLRDEMVLLEMALHRMALEKLSKKGFTLAQVPSLCRESALYGTGHFPTGRDQVYHLQEDDLYLSGTAEVQLNSLHSGQIIKEADLPILYAGYSPCFRREAGSYGRDVRGLIRVHQFMKVEQYVICKNDPAESEKWHKALLETSLELVRELELPFRVVECCTGDMGVGKYRMYDVECWVPSEGKYRETHSCSNLHDWQSRRTNTRYRDGEGNVQYCHSLNNTAVATPRILVCLLECHQQADGSVKIPGALGPFMGGLSSIKGKSAK